MKSEHKESIQILTLEGKPHEIDELGSLGLLALGYRGLLAWREKRSAMGAKRNSNNISSS